VIGNLTVTCKCLTSSPVWVKSFRSLIILKSSRNVSLCLRCTDRKRHNSGEVPVWNRIYTETQKLGSVGLGERRGCRACTARFCVVVDWQLKAVQCRHSLARRTCCWGRFITWVVTSAWWCASSRSDPTACCCIHLNIRTAGETSSLCPLDTDMSSSGTRRFLHLISHFSNS